MTRRRWGALVMALMGVGCAHGGARTASAAEASCPAPSRGAVAPRCQGALPPVVSVAGDAVILQDLGMQLDPPTPQAWAVSRDGLGDVSALEGTCPVVLSHQASGTQIVLQASEPAPMPLGELGQSLRDRLAAEAPIDVGPVQPLPAARGAEACGFDFALVGAAAGRVALVSAGGHVVLVVASWPEGVDQAVVDEVDQVVRSLRAIGDTTGAPPKRVTPTRSAPVPTPVPTPVRHPPAPIRPDKA